MIIRSFDFKHLESNQYIEWIKRHRIQIKIAIKIMIVICFVLLFLGGSNAFFEQKHKEALLSMGLFFGMLVGGCGAGVLLFYPKYRVFLREPLVEIGLYLLIFLGAFQMIEIYNRHGLNDLSGWIFFLGFLLVLFIYAFCYVIFGHTRRMLITGTIFLYPFGTTCHYVYLMRGTPFVPMDFFSIGTALSVADHYIFELTTEWKLATALGILLCLYAKFLPVRRLSTVKGQLLTRGAACLLIVVGLLTFFNNSILQKNHVALNFWDQASNYEKYGSLVTFGVNLKYLYPDKPIAYTPYEIPQLVNDTLRAAGVEPTSDRSYNMLTGYNDYVASGKKPNIIVIMNESLADLEALGALETNEPVMPFLKSLKENTIRGTLQVSVFGGGTAVTEYEMLTGNAERFLPSGAVAYMSSMKHTVPSLAWTLREQGYDTMAFHSYYKEDWGRPMAYQHMGFSRYVGLEDVIDFKGFNDKKEDFLGYVERTAYKADGDAYNRYYMSDHQNYKLVEKFYEEHDPSKPFFMFNVTMQNHGDYADAYGNFEEKIHITNMGDRYPYANRYLSLIRSTDEATAELVNYFKNVKEPTVLLIFGDHQAALDKGFYDELFGEPIDTMTRVSMQKRFQTPFVIWANYDIPEKNMGQLSANYLSPLLLQVSGQPLTSYQKYLALLSREVPAISNLGFVDKQNKFYTMQDMMPFDYLIDSYQRIAYNHLLDKNGKQWQIFTLGGEAMEETDIK